MHKRVVIGLEDDLRDHEKADFERAQRKDGVSLATFMSGYGGQR